MIAAFLATYLATQQWNWNAVDTATSYRIYWSDLATRWCTQNRMEFDSFYFCGTAVGCEDNNSCCADVPEPQYPLAFFIITAVNAAGEGPTEHGPVVTCP